MSYDVFLLNHAGPPLTGEALLGPWLEDDEAPLPASLVPLGPPKAVQALLARALTGYVPAADDGGAFQAERVGFDLDFLKRGDEVVAIELHAHGDGDPMPFIGRLMRDGGWQAYDPQTDAYLDPDRPSELGWRGYRSTLERVQAAVEAREAARRQAGRLGMFWRIGTYLALMAFGSQLMPGVAAPVRAIVALIVAFVVGWVIWRRALPAQDLELPG